MSLVTLHHVSIPVRDIDQALVFYQAVLGLKQISRPNFPGKGAWLACGNGQIHLALNPSGTFRAKRDISPIDIHFAMRVEDFEATLQKFRSLGFSEEHPIGHAQKLFLDRKSIAGYPQVFLTDPDFNIIEVNSA